MAGLFKSCIKKSYRSNINKCQHMYLFNNNLTFEKGQQQGQGPTLVWQNMRVLNQCQGYATFPFYVLENKGHTPNFEIMNLNQTCSNYKQKKKPMPYLTLNHPYKTSPLKFEVKNTVQTIY